MPIAKPQTAQSQEVVFLTREHHDGLLLSWKINSGLNKGVSLKRIKEYVIYFFENFLEPHLLMEEQIIYSLVDAEQPDRRMAELQHAGLRVRIEYFKAGYAMAANILRDFAQLLSDHIRFEERVLFQLIEEQADPVALRSVVKKYKNVLTVDNGWRDQFWLK